MDKDLSRRYKIGMPILWGIGGGLIGALTLLCLFYSSIGVQLNPVEYVSLIIALIAITLSAII